MWGYLGGINIDRLDYYNQTTTFSHSHSQSPTVNTSSAKKFPSPAIMDRFNGYNNNEDECLDLSLKDCYLVVYYRVSDPGMEYDILNVKNVVDSWTILTRGVCVSVKFGHARVQGLVVAVSDEYGDLEKRFQSIVEEHQESLYSGEYLRIRPARDGGHRKNKEIVKMNNRATQTEHPTCSDEPMYIDYMKLKQQYEEMEQKLNEATEKMHYLTSNGTIDDKRTIAVKKELFRKGKTDDENKENMQDDYNEKVRFGMNGTEVLKSVFDTINWTSYTAATRKLLITLFPRKTLATHSLSGRPSPAFLHMQTNKLTKMKLDPLIIGDIVSIVSRKCNISGSLVRSAITTKCADENKLYKKRMEKIEIEEKMQQ